VRKALLMLSVQTIVLLFGSSDVLAMEYQILPVNPFMILPFIFLLLSIALVPFISGGWWERNYPAVSLSLGAVSVVYYFFILKNGQRMLGTGLEYFSFITLIGSLFVVSGGIHIRVGGRSTPIANVVLLGIGAVISNLLGTTGASMILIRPFLKMNKYRISGYHVVFFIFIVSNIGGLLTPVGDPPLFLGYLKGIPFFWVISHTWKIWFMSVSIILFIFYIIDRHNYRKLPEKLEHETAEKGEKALVEGMHNIIFLSAIIGSVFLQEPIREIVMIASAAGSYLTTKREVHEKNSFNYIPIKEVAVLFAGIFATMVPALDWLELNAGKLGVTEPAHFFWLSGALSSFLDNAPAYLNFLCAAFGLHGLNVDNAVHVQVMLCSIPAGDVQFHAMQQASGIKPLTEHTWKYVQAISAGAVMFGANTYIGNGPNFMVKSIAEQANVKMPSFLGYMVKYSIPILIPVFIAVWYIFFR